MDSLTIELPQKKLIVIDARVVLENHGHGIARYTEEFLRNLLLLPSEFSFAILVNRKSPLLSLTWPPHIQLHILKTGWIDFLMGQLELAVVLWRLKPDLFHSPSFIVPFLSNRPLITTIHDLNHVVLGENYSIFHRLYYSFFLARKIRSAKSVITVSKFSREEIVRFFGIPKSQVCVIHNGIDTAFRPMTSADSQVLKHFKDRLELPDNYILSIGNRKPHKNICRMVEAYCRAPIEEPLVLLTDFDPRILEIAQRYNKKHKIYFLRFVSNEVLPYVYAMARVFVYPSLYEGFGFPPLEAAACGIPVVVSDRTSLPEVMADCAVYVNPEDLDDIARGIQLALKNSPEKQGRVVGGLELVKRYSWKKMAEETLMIYGSVLAAQKQSESHNEAANKGRSNV